MFTTTESHRPLPGLSSIYSAGTLAAGDDELRSDRTKAKVEIITENKIGKKVQKLLKKIPADAAFSKESLNKQLLFMAKTLDKYRNFW